MATTGASGADPIDVAVGARLRMRRQELGMSQQLLAGRLGVSFQQVQKYERGSNRISASMLVRAARALGCHPGLLLSGQPEGEPAGVNQEDALQAELAAMLATPGAVDLLRAYARVRESDARNAVIAVVRGLSAGSASAASR